MQTYEVINDILVNLFNEILKREEEAIITEEFKIGRASCRERV